MLKTKFVTLTALATFALTGMPASAKNCNKGKPCGDTCISQNDTCHIGSSGTSTNSPASEARVPQSASDRINGVAKTANNVTANGKVCKTGKPCGNSCISMSATCHSDMVAKNTKSKKHRKHK
jgi:hypothetical protein